MIGTVTKYFQDKGYGFIVGDDRQTYFIHKSKLQGEHIEKGYRVFFRWYANDRGDYYAKDVNVIESDERERKNGKKNK